MNDQSSNAIYGDEAWQHLLHDPRLSEMKIGETRVLTAERLPVRGESRFFMYRDAANFQYPSAKMKWENMPNDIRRVGDGYGFSVLNEKPVLREDKPKPKRFPDAWVAWGHFICSEKFVDVLKELDPAALEYIPIDYHFSDGSSPDGQYYFLDIVRNGDFVDWINSNINVKKLTLSPSGQGVFYSRMPTKISINPDIPENIHMFRNISVSNAFFSRQMVEIVMRANLSGPDFTDPAQ